MRFFTIQYRHLVKLQLRSLSPRSASTSSCTYTTSFRRQAEGTHKNSPSLRLNTTFMTLFFSSASSSASAFAASSQGNGPRRFFNSTRQHLRAVFGIGISKFTATALGRGEPDGNGLRGVISRCYCVSIFGMGSGEGPDRWIGWLLMFCWFATSCFCIWPRSRG